MIRYFGNIFFAFMTLAILASCAHPAHAEDAQLYMKCGNKQLHFTQHDRQPVLLTIEGQKGVYMMIPDSKQGAYYINLDSEKVISVDQNNSTEFVVKFFNSVRDTQVNMPVEKYTCQVN